MSGDTLYCIAVWLHSEAVPTSDITAARASRPNRFLSGQGIIAAQLVVSGVCPSVHIQ